MIKNKTFTTRETKIGNMNPIINDLCEVYNGIMSQGTKYFTNIKTRQIEDKCIDNINHNVTNVGHFFLAAVLNIYTYIKKKIPEGKQTEGEIDATFCLHLTSILYCICICIIPTYTNNYNIMVTPFLGPCVTGGQVLATIKESTGIELNGYVSLLISLAIGKFIKR